MTLLIAFLLLAQVGATWPVYLMTFVLWALHIVWHATTPGK